MKRQTIWPGLGPSDLASTAGKGCSVLERRSGRWILLLASTLVCGSGTAQGAGPLGELGRWLGYGWGPGYRAEWRTAVHGQVACWTPSVAGAIQPTELPWPTGRALEAAHSSSSAAAFRPPVSSGDQPARILPQRHFWRGAEAWSGSAPASRHSPAHPPGGTRFDW